jgi:hypothetical protein
MMRLNKAGYEQLVNEDIAWLEKIPRTLERDHIIAVLKASIEHEYPSRKFSVDDLFPESLCSKECGPNCTSDHK